MNNPIETVKILASDIFKNKKIENKGFRKSKAKKILTDKIKYFWLSSVYSLFDIKSMTDLNLEQMINAFNEQKITLEKAKINYELKILDNLNDIDAYNANVELNENAEDTYIKDLLDSNLNKSIDGANKSEKKINLLDEKIEKIEDEQEVRALDIEEVVNNDLEEYDESVNEGNDILPIDKISNEQIIKKVQAEIQTMDETNLTEEVKPSFLDEAVANYEKNLNDLKDKSNNRFLEVSNELLLKFKEQADEYTNLVVQDIANAAKVAIEKANANTEKAIIEKISMEKDSKEYQNRYEQTLKVVSERDETIVGLNIEISNLNSNISSKEDEIITINKEKEALSSELLQKDDVISKQDININELQITVSRILANSYKASQENEDADKDIEKEDKQISKKK